MRGCLFTLLLGAVAIGLFVVLGLPAIAAGALTAGVGAAGLHADDTTVTVSSDPPTDLLGLHADRVHLTASDATFRGLRIGSLDVLLGDMALVDRTAETVDGRLRQVVVPDVAGSPLTIDTIRLGGGGTRITATATIPGDDVEARLADAVERTLGDAADDGLARGPRPRHRSSWAAPVTGRFAVTPGGDLVIRITSGPAKGEQVPVIPGDGLPLRLTDVSVDTAGNLVLSGELAVGLFG